MLDLEKFIVIGISHEELSLEEREAFVKTKPKNKIHNLFKENKINSYVNLSTCLRVEFYIKLDEIEYLKEIKEVFTCFTKDKLHTIIYGTAAVEYLFKLSCGFYSVIKGEDQILAQVKIAYSEALENNHSSKIMNIIFNKTIELGKKFRTVSNINHNALSLEAISLKFINSKFNDLKSKRIFILGIGDLSQSILKLLLKENLKNIYITNRTYHTAEAVKDKFPEIKLVSYKEKYMALVEADIIISATSAPHYVVEYEKFMSKIKRDKEYLFLDLAVPRDVDEKLGREENIKIYNLDDVWEIYNENSSNRSRILEEYYYLIAEHKEKLIEKIEKTLEYV